MNTQLKNVSVMDTPGSDTLPEEIRQYGVTPNEFNNLRMNLFPGASLNAIKQVIAYCKARNLDPMKKPCHIVPMYVKDANGRGSMRDVVMPGIYELRTTAARTGEYLGLSEWRYGPEITTLGVTVPQWIEVTAYRRVGPMLRTISETPDRAEFTFRAWFTESCATKKDGTLNAMWMKRPISQLTKCAEAGALRMAFPDDIGGEMTVEEMAGQHDVVNHEPSEVSESAPQADKLKALIGAVDKTDQEIEASEEGNENVVSE